MTTVSLRGRSGGFSTSSSQISFLGRVKRTWQYRRILELLVRRDLKVRYAGSALGYLWSVLDPLLMSLVYWFVFTKIFHRHVTFQPYILFLVIGQITYAWFQGGVSTGAKALHKEAQMVRSTNVPRELWVVRVVASKGVEWVYSLPVVAIFALAYLKKPTLGVVYLPLAALLAFFLTLSLGLILAPITVLVRDIDRIIPVALRVLFYCSPVVYSVHDVPQSVHAIYAFNPTVGMLELARAAFFPAELQWQSVLTSSIDIVVLFTIGVFVFTRFERQVLKEI